MRRLALAPLALLLLVAGAQAHAAYLSSEPASGARLAVAPTDIHVTFSEPVDVAGTSLELQDASGATLGLGPLRQDSATTVRVAIVQALGEGAYRVIWQTLSGADGHVERGAFGFAVGNATPPAPDLVATGVVWGSAAARTLLYGGLALALGALAFWAFILPRDPRALGPLTLGAAIHLAGVVWLLAETRGQTGLDVPTFLASGVGRLLKERLVAAALAALGASGALVSRELRGVGAATAGVALAWAAVDAARLSHAAGQGLAGALIDLIHLVAAATWVGSLALFVWTLRRPPAGLPALGRRFGTVALSCVIALVVAGLLAEVVILGPLVLEPATILATPWGLAIAGKMALTVVMVAVAGINRYVVLADEAPRGLARRLRNAGTSLTRGRLKPISQQAGSLRRLVAAEAAMGIVILGLAGILTTVSPPEPPVALEMTVDAQGASYSITGAWVPPPLSGGESTFTFRIADSSGATLSSSDCGRASCVTLTLESLAAQHEGHQSAPETHNAVPTGDGRWLVRDVLWVHPGAEKATLDIQSAAVFRDTMTFTFEVAE